MADVRFRRLFEFADRERDIAGGAHAFEAPLHEFVEPAGQGPVLRKRFRQNDRILDRHAAAGGQVRGHGVGGVADENHALAIPGRRNERIFKRPPNHFIRRAHALAHLDHDRRREVLQRLFQNEMRLALVDPRVGRIAHGREQIHRVLAQRNEARFELRSDKDVDLVDRWVALGHEAIDALSDIDRLVGLAEHAFADAGEHAVGADHKIVAAARAVGETHVDAGGVLAQVGDGQARADGSAFGLGAFGHEIGKDRPLQTDRGGKPRHRWRQRIGRLQFALAVADQEEVEAKAPLGAAGRKADPVERAQGAARERDADADDPGFDFDDLGGDPALPQCNSQSQSADPCADNQDALYRRHRSSP